MKRCLGILPLFFCLLLGIPSLVVATDNDLVYTIQAGSFQSLEKALNEFETLQQEQIAPDLALLRIEEIGGLFAVRFGSFASREAAGLVLERIQVRRPGAIILKAYIIAGRTRKILAALPVEKPGAVDRVVAESPPGGTEISEHAAEDAGLVILQTPPLAELTVQPQIIAGQPGGETVGVGDVQKTTLPSMGSGEEAGSEPSAGVVPLQAEDMTAIRPPAGSPPVAVEGQAAAGGLQSAADFVGTRRPALLPPRGLLPAKTLAILQSDEQGLPIGYPQHVYYDQNARELYAVVSGGGSRVSSSRVVVYGHDYFPLATLGSGRGLFSPEGLTVDADGRIFVCQFGSDGKPNRISIFNAAFFMEKEIFIDSLGGVDDFVPSRIAIGKDGSMYVVGHNVKGVAVLDSNGSFLRWLVPLKIGQKRVKGPLTPASPGAEKARDVVIDANGRIYVLCEAESLVYVFSPDEEFLFSFGTKGGSSGKLSRPRSVAVDERRQVIYVVDYMRHSILAYRYADGSYIFELGGRGFSPGWFNFPNHIAVGNQGQLIVADLFNHRIQVLEVH